MSAVDSMQKEFCTPRPIEFRVSENEVLRADALGDPARPAVLLAHGGGQTRYAWAGAAAALAEAGRYAVALDLRGHGESDWAADGDYTLAAFADDFRQIAATLNRPAMVGASLGGFAAMLAEGEAPGGLFSALVLVDIAPRIQTEGAERIVAFMNAHLEDGFASVEEAGQAVAAYLPHRAARSNVEGLRKNLRLGPDGRYRWHWDPAFLRRDRTSFESEVPRVHAAARQIKTPTLLLRGSRSDLVSPEDAQHFLTVVPHAQYRDVSGAGHMVAGDKNDLFIAAMLEFLKT